MMKTFADTFYYLAILNPQDAAHERALQATANNASQLVTTRWVLTEVGDAMAAPRYRKRFEALVQAIESDADTVITPATEHTFQAGMELFASRSDKAWSLTDCISFVVMEQLQIQEALTGDHHFAQAGFVPLLADR